jgi:nucleoside-diphosphate-sugar epimerase
VRVFVAGASGVIGRRLVPLLVDAAHEVTGMTRSPETAAAMRGAGVEAVVCDALDAPAVRAAVRDAAPDAVVHQLTAIPWRIDPRRFARDLELNDRLRTEGTRILVDAAEAAGASRIVAQSIAFAYEPTGARVKDEDAPLYVDAPKAFRRSARAIAALEQTVLSAGGVVLRYGYFYGPGTGFDRDGYMGVDVARRRVPIVGSGRGVWSFIHVDDAARATVAALTRGRSAPYNVVDDEPAEVREWLPAYAAALGAKPPLRAPALLARLVAGRYGVQVMTELRGASNARAKLELGLTLAYPSWRDGFAAALATGSTPGPRSRPRSQPT